MATILEKAYQFVMNELNDIKIDRRRRRKYKLSRKREIILAQMKAEADRRTLLTGKKHWIVTDHDGAFIILNRERIRAFIKHGKLSKKVTPFDFDKEAIYTTQVSPRKFIGDATAIEKPVKENVISKFWRVVIMGG